MDAELTPQELNKTAFHLMALKMFSLASCVMLYYDILLTFGEEVKCIWMRRFTKFTILWFLVRLSFAFISGTSRVLKSPKNRYLSPLGFIFIIFAFHSNWSPQVCNRYVLFPEIIRLFINAVLGTIFIIRLYALYGTSWKIMALMSILLSAELGVKIYASLTNGQRLILPPGLVGCILVGKDQVRFSMTWVAELAFDSTVFLLTVFRTVYLNHSMKGTTMSLLHLMFRDGVVYFAVICAANIVTSVMFLVAPGDIKAFNATFSSLITSLMVSRLILNLRSVGAKNLDSRAGITGLESFIANNDLHRRLPPGSIYTDDTDSWQIQAYPLSPLRFGQRSGINALERTTQSVV